MELARITTPDAAGPTVGANCRGVFAAIAIRGGLRVRMGQGDVGGNGNELGTHDVPRFGPSGRGNTLLLLV